MKEKVNKKEEKKEDKKNPQMTLNKYSTSVIIKQKPLEFFKKPAVDAWRD